MTHCVFFPRLPSIFERKPRFPTFQTEQTLMLKHQARKPRTSVPHEHIRNPDFQESKPPPLQLLRQGAACAERFEASGFVRCPNGSVVQGFRSSIKLHELPEGLGLWGLGRFRRCCKGFGVFCNGGLRVIREFPKTGDPNIVP